MINEKGRGFFASLIHFKRTIVCFLILSSIGFLTNCEKEDAIQVNPDLTGAALKAGVGALAGGVGAAPGAVGFACYSSAGRGIVALTEHWGLW